MALGTLGLGAIYMGSKKLLNNIESNKLASFRNALLDLGEDASEDDVVNAMNKNVLHGASRDYGEQSIRIGMESRKYKKAIKNSAREWLKKRNETTKLASDYRAGFFQGQFAAERARSGKMGRFGFRSKKYVNDIVYPAYKNNLNIIVPGSILFVIGQLAEKYGVALLGLATMVVGDFKAGLEMKKADEAWLKEKGIYLKDGRYYFTDEAKAKYIDKTAALNELDFLEPNPTLEDVEGAMRRNVLYAAKHPYKKVLPKAILTGAFTTFTMLPGTKSRRYSALLGAGVTGLSTLLGGKVIKRSAERTIANPRYGKYITNNAIHYLNNKNIGIDGLEFNE